MYHTIFVSTESVSLKTEAFIHFELQMQKQIPPLKTDLFIGDHWEVSSLLDFNHLHVFLIYSMKLKIKYPF